MANTNGNSKDPKTAQPDKPVRPGIDVPEIKDPPNDLPDYTDPPEPTQPRDPGRPIIRSREFDPNDLANYVRDPSEYIREPGEMMYYIRDPMPSEVPYRL